MSEMIERAITALLTLIRDGHALVLTLSGGKDSTSTVLLGLEAIRRATQEGVVQPKHYVTSADTTIDNPAMMNHLFILHDEIDAFVKSANLPVEMKVARPSLASQFVVSTIGRGTLVRTPENGVKDGKKKRPCADDWKVEPQAKLAKGLMEEVLSQGFREPVTCLGSRKAESTSRTASMAEQDAQADRATRNKSGDLTISPLADWSTDDVWNFLGLFNNPTQQSPFPCFTDGQSIDRMLELYRDGNEGMCGVVQGDGGYKAACGSRFGCAFCCITGERDKSMESMIKEPKHAHLAGLNRFRNYLVNTQWDMSKRELVGRSLSPAGFLRLQPDVYSMQHRLTLLRMLLTLDANEKDRAEKHAEDLWSGQIPDTAENRQLADIQFQMITPQQLVAIDFQLALHHYAERAFPALSIWQDVYEFGRRVSIPDVEPLPKVDIKPLGWYHVGAYDREVPTDGLRSYLAEQWNGYLHPERVGTYCVTSNGEKVAWFEEAPEFTVDAEAACAFVTCEFDVRFMLEAQQFSPLESARFWLNEGIVKLAKGSAWTYQDMAKRGQYFATLCDNLNLTTPELDAYLVEHAISDEEHDRLLSEIGSAASPHTQQYDMFKMAA